MRNVPRTISFSWHNMYWLHNVRTENSIRNWKRFVDEILFLGRWANVTKSMAFEWNGRTIVASRHIQMLNDLLSNSFIWTNNNVNVNFKAASTLDISHRNSTRYQFHISHPHLILRKKMSFSVYVASESIEWWKYRYCLEMTKTKIARFLNWLMVKKSIRQLNLLIETHLKDSIQCSPMPDLRPTSYWILSLTINTKGIHNPWCALIIIWVSLTVTGESVAALHFYFLS